jgi:hypothetical protein
MATSTASKCSSGDCFDQGVELLRKPMVLVIICISCTSRHLLQDFYSHCPQMSNSEQMGHELGGSRLSICATSQYSPLLKSTFQK